MVVQHVAAHGKDAACFRFRLDDPAWQARLLERAVALRVRWLRLPYGEKTISVKSFNFNEEVVGSHDKYLWGHASIALTSRIVDSFAKFRWCPNIIGPQAGRRWVDPLGSPQVRRATPR